MKKNQKITIFKRVRKGREDLFMPYKFNSHFQDCRGMNIQQSSRSLNEIDNIKVFIDLTDIKINKNDYLLKGTTDKEYSSLEEIKKDFQDVFIITSVDTFKFGSKRLQHIRIGAK